MALALLWLTRLRTRARIVCGIPILYREYYHPIVHDHRQCSLPGVIARVDARIYLLLVRPVVSQSERAPIG
jgi:hypothetical protein